MAGTRVNGRNPEKITKAFVNTIRQITPSYQRRILFFLARNPGRRFTNIQIAHALEEDRSNIWRFLNLIIEEAKENSMVERLVEGGDVLYSWKEPGITIDGLKISEILRVLEALEGGKG